MRIISLPKMRAGVPESKICGAEGIDQEALEGSPQKAAGDGKRDPVMDDNPSRPAVQLDIHKGNRWLKDALAAAGFGRVMFGSADLSWEQGYYQFHWHIGMWTSNRKQLTKRLKAIFPSTRKKLKKHLAIFPSDKKYRRPVVVSNTWSLGFIPYKDKAVKLPDLLRRNRTHLPELLLALDRTKPLELMICPGSGSVLRTVGWSYGRWASPEKHERRPCAA